MHRSTKFSTRQCNQRSSRKDSPLSPANQEPGLLVNIVGRSPTYWRKHLCQHCQNCYSEKSVFRGCAGRVERLSSSNRATHTFQLKHGLYQLTEQGI